MPDFDYLAAAWWLQLFQALATCLVVIYVYILSKSKANRGRIEIMQEELDGLGEKVAVMVERDKHGPTHDDLDKLHARITDVVREVEGIKGTVNQINVTVSTINEHLIQQGGK